jgi:hypothetical protein
MINKAGILNQGIRLRSRNFLEMLITEPYYRYIDYESATLVPTHEVFNVIMKV